MKLKEGYVLYRTEDERLLVATGDAAQEFNGMARYNEPAYFLMEKLQNDVTEEELVEALLAEYDVEREQAVRDVREFVAKLRKEGFISD